MKYAAALFSLAASPALAHPASLTHGHGADWMVVAALALIGLAGAVARAKAVKVRK